MSNKQDLKVGQELWYVPNRGGLGLPYWPVIVEKVGRKWAFLARGVRVDLQTLIVDGGPYPPQGRCYLSREDYERELARQDAEVGGEGVSDGR